MTAIKMRCETCTHWSDFNITNEYQLGWGVCVRGSGEYGRPAYADTLMVAHDSDGEGGGVLTKPNFGCVMYEARP